MKSILFPVVVGMVVLAGCSSPEKKIVEEKVPAEKAPAEKAILPRQAPPIFKAQFDTSKGHFTVEVHRDWAPIGADRFHQLIEEKFFDEVRFFRVVPNFMVQFGISGDPKVASVWKRRNLPDDPVKQSNTRGTVTFATAGPGTRTTQFFINFANNASLDQQGFAPFGKVIEGMSVVDHIYPGYGESPDQGQLEAEGNSYLKGKFERLDYIKSVQVTP